MGTSVHVYLPAGKTEHKATSIQEGSIGLDVPPTHATNSALDLELALRAKTGNKRGCRETLPEKNHDLAMWGVKSSFISPARRATRGSQRK